MSEQAPLREAIATRLGADRLVADAERGERPELDLCDYPLGEAAAWVRPRSHEEVVELVRLVREAGTRLVPVGHRTAYWRPLAYDGAVVLDTRGLTGIEDVGDSIVVVEAGTPVRELHRHARARGLELPAQPDAFGETSVGAMVATDMAAGIGMGAGTFRGFVTGLRVVLGTGETLHTGAGASLGVAPFMAEGLPDPTSLFFGAEGALGVITGVFVRLVAHRPKRSLSFAPSPDAAAWEHLRAMAHHPELRGRYDTFRCVEENSPAGTSLTCDVVIVGLDDAEALARTERARAVITDTLSCPVEVEEEPEGPDGRAPDWLGSMHEHWTRMAGLRFSGVDVLVPHSAAEEALELGARIVQDALGTGSVGARRAAYMAPDRFNLGLHVVFERGSTSVEASHAFVERSMKTLLSLPSVPYRYGRMWRGLLNDRIDPAYVSSMRAMQAILDPDRVIHPDASVFGGP